MLIWDLPMRLYHAALVLVLLAAFATGLTHHALWHGWVGRALAVLLVWRVLWGIAGSDTARFTAFLVNPLPPLRRPGPDDGFGHAAAGGALLPLTLVWLALVLASGFAHFPAHRLLAYTLLLPVALHLVVIAAASARHEAPLRAILVGKKKLPAATRAPRRASPGLALVALACALALVAVLSRLLA